MQNFNFESRNRLFTFAVALFFMGSDLIAAGLIDLPRTGQTNSYCAGDDGALQAGAPWPEPRFTNHGDGSATDRLTGLMWVTDGNLVRRVILSSIRMARPEMAS